jgi:DNA replication and repair protein RecF
MQQLASRLESDLRLGYTNRGPHRAELDISTDADAVSKRLSRGQQKLLVFALNLALVDLVAEKTGRRPVLLVDDLAAELDGGNKARLLSEIEQRDLQCFLTVIDPEILPIEVVTAPRVFHVKQGQLSDC